MANEIFSPFGGQVTGVLGGDFASKLQPYIVNSGDTSTMYIGDFVRSFGESNPDGTGNQLPRVTLASAGTVILGVIAGFEANSASLDTTSRLGSTERVVYIHDNVYVELDIQADGAVSSTDVGKNADIRYYSAEEGGAFFTSGVALDTSTLDAATAQLRVMRFATGSSPSDNYPVMKCLINEHFYKQILGV